MSIEINDHYHGVYYMEPKCDINPSASTIAQAYRNKRKMFLELLNQVRPEYRRKMVEIEIEENENQLKKIAPDVFNSYLENTLFHDFHVNTQIYEDAKLLLASYLEFLSILIKQYEKIEVLNFTDVKWLKDVSSFQKFYEILNKYNIINADYLRFQSFFSLKNELMFYSNIYETTTIFFQLIEENYISNTTLDSLLNNSLIIAKNGKTANSFQIITKNTFNRNTSKINQEFDVTKVGKDVNAALKEFGIKM